MSFYSSGGKGFARVLFCPLDPLPSNSVLFPALENDQTTGLTGGPVSKKMKSSTSGSVEDLDIEVAYHSKVSVSRLPYFPLIMTTAMKTIRGLFILFFVPDFEDVPAAKWLHIVHLVNEEEVRRERR